MSPPRSARRSTRPWPEPEARFGTAGEFARAVAEDRPAPPEATVAVTAVPPPRAKPSSAPRGRGRRPGPGIGRVPAVLAHSRPCLETRCRPACSRALRRAGPEASALARGPRGSAGAQPRRRGQAANRRPDQRHPALDRPGRPTLGGRARATDGRGAHARGKPRAVGRRFGSPPGQAVRGRDGEAAGRSGAAGCQRPTRSPERFADRAAAGRARADPAGRAHARRIPWVQLDARDEGVPGG